MTVLKPHQDITKTKPCWYFIYIFTILECFFVFYTQCWITRILCWVWINGFYFVDHPRGERHRFFKSVFTAITFTCVIFLSLATQYWSNSSQYLAVILIQSTHNRWSTGSTGCPFVNSELTLQLCCYCVNCDSVLYMPAIYHASLLHGFCVHLDNYFNCNWCYKLFIRFGFYLWLSKLLANESWCIVFHI